MTAQTYPEGGYRGDGPGRLHHLPGVPEQWEWIAKIFSQECILKGAFDKFADSETDKKGTMGVDEAFLADIEAWRDILARNIALRNPEITVDELNIAVQRTIDRIIFLRISEDRGSRAVWDVAGAAFRRPGFIGVSVISSAMPTTGITRGCSTLRRSRAE